LAFHGHFEKEARTLATRKLTAIIPASLPLLRCVYPVQAYPLAPDFERVTVDHPDRAGHVNKGWRG
jgi:hypothetical protein